MRAAPLGRPHSLRGPRARVSEPGLARRPSVGSFDQLVQFRGQIAASKIGDVNVYGALGLEEGDAHVIRNAGGVVTDDEFKQSIEQETGIKPEWAAEAFSDVDADVRQSIGRIKASPFIPVKDSIRGFIYEVESGRLREVR